LNFIIPLKTGGWSDQFFAAVATRREGQRAAVVARLMGTGQPLYFDCGEWETDLARDPGKDIGIHVRRLAYACPIAGKQQPLFQIRAQQGSSDNRRFCLHGGRPTRRTCRSPDAVKKLNRRSFHIHLRGFFSSITPQVAAAVIPASATSSKTSSGVPIGVILANSRSIDHRSRNEHRVHRATPSIAVF
jgi:hypothetical protein